MCCNRKYHSLPQTLWFSFFSHLPSRCFIFYHLSGGPLLVGVPVFNSQALESEAGQLALLLEQYTSRTTSPPRHLTSFDVLEMLSLLYKVFLSHRTV